MKTAALDGALLMLIAAALIWPLFQVEYFDNWMSIDGAFIADARFLSDNLPSPGWTPYFYGGNRFDYLYPPAVRYGSALITRYRGASPDHVSVVSVLIADNSGWSDDPGHTGGHRTTLGRGEGMHRRSNNLPNGLRPLIDGDTRHVQKMIVKPYAENCTYGLKGR